MEIKWLVQFTICGLISLTRAEPRCPRGWSYYGNSCYGLARERMSWSEAGNTCAMYRSELAQIESKEENDFIKTIVRNVTYPSDIKGVWLGGSDIFAEGKWEWVGSRSPIEEYTDWGPNEPNSITNGGREDCLTMWRDLSWEWNDENCQSDYVYFLCETEPDYTAEIIG